MNNQTLLLFAIGAFVTLIVAVAAVDQYLLDKHPTSEVGGLLWRTWKAFEAIQDLEATILVTTEEHPTYTVRYKVRYIKGPPPVLSMRYLPLEEATQDQFSTTVRDETFTVKNDQLFQYIPSEDTVLSKRWPGFQLARIGLGILDITQIRQDWKDKRVAIRILPDISGFSGLTFAAHLTLDETITSFPFVSTRMFSIPELEDTNDYSLCFSFCPDFDAQSTAPLLSLGVAQALDASAGSAMPSSYILEVRDASTDKLIRMIWIDRETYFIQKTIVFDQGQRESTLLVQLRTTDQGLTEEDVVTPPESGVENIQG